MFIAGVFVGAGVVLIYSIGAYYSKRYGKKKMEEEVRKAYEAGYNKGKIERMDNIIKQWKA